MSRWTHAVCGECYSELEPGREPARMVNAEPETCCVCGDATRAGIYYRANPDVMGYCAHRPED